MRFPAMNKQSKRRIGIPELSGGINLRDNPTQCNDNQLTELVNMWYKDGMLRTRPGEKLIVSTVINEPEPILGGQHFIECKTHSDINRVNANGNAEQLVSCKETFLSRADESTPWQTTLFSLHFFWAGTDGITQLPSISKANVELKNYFAIQSQGVFYCFIKTSTEYSVYVLKPEQESWEPVEEKDYYVPTVYHHCKVTRGAEFSGTMFESFNLIGNKFKIIYSTVNKNISPVSGESGTHLHEMYYPFPEGMINNPEEYVGKEVKAIITDENGLKTTHTAIFDAISDDGLNATGWEKNLNQKDGLIMEISTQNITFWIDQSGDGTVKDPAKIYEDAIYVEDNLEIIMPFIPTLEEKNKIFNMTRCEWFGGASAGLAGGTRLFLCGNSDENEKSLVCWSGLNKPLYFPENSYFYVGDTSEAVTGFGKQSDMLVIFKETETWYTQYHQNTSITADDLIDPRVIDIQSSAVYFPLVQINPSIGCPYPDTVQLCRNRLVWLGSGDRVYSLVSGNQYSERSIFVLSEMVQRKLRNEMSLNATACDWDGYYCLKIGEHMYLMDYNSYGYIYAAGHSKTEDANLRIPWYYWRLPRNTDLVGSNTLLVCNNDMFIFEADTRNRSCSLLAFKDGQNFDVQDDSLINSIAQTKLFNFGEPNSYKNISSVGLSLGFNGGNEITVTFITDSGEEQTGLVLEDEAEERSAGFTQSRILYPAICSAVQFGIRLECEGNMIIDGLALDYRVTGRAR